MTHERHDCASLSVKYQCPDPRWGLKFETSPLTSTVPGTPARTARSIWNVSCVTESGAGCGLPGAASIGEGAAGSARRAVSFSRNSKKFVDIVRTEKNYPLKRARR